MLLDVLDRVVSVLDHVVEQRGAYRGRPQSYLLTCNLGHGDRVEDIGLARAAADAAVCLARKLKGALDYLDLAAVIAPQIAVQHVLKFSFDKPVLLFGCQAVGLAHILQWVYKAKLVNIADMTKKIYIPARRSGIMTRLSAPPRLIFATRTNWSN